MTTRKRTSSLVVSSCRRLARRALLPAALACLGLGGCANFFEDVTSRDFEIKQLFAPPPDPLVVLRDSYDGDKRARALRALGDPKRKHESAPDEERILEVLTTAAASERSMLCRLAAVSSLGHFNDPRAAAGLKDAYYHAADRAGLGGFSPEQVSMLRCQTLTSLGETGHPAAVELLVKVVREPAVEGPDVDKQQKTDERLAATRALGHFKHYQATEALVAVLKTEKDVAMRDRAHEGLQLVTGKRLPPDGRVWEDFLHKTDKDALYGEPSFGDKVRDIVSVNWWWK